MAGDKPDRPAWIRFAGIGVEFAAAVAGFTVVGYWIDNHYGSSPKGVLIGAVLGLIGGTYNLIRESLGAFKVAARQDSGRRLEKGSHKKDANDIE